jgi:AraC-like DNA-binding protein
LLDRFLAARLARGPTMPEPVSRAWELLTGSSGRLDIATVADQVGWTRQHLAARFGEQIGLTPKAVARVARLHRAASLLSVATPPSLAEVAQRCGYADQPHLHRDFRMLTGCTPGGSAKLVHRA